jgi:hypothetical protein
VIAWTPAERRIVVVVALVGLSFVVVSALGGGAAFIVSMVAAAAGSIYLHRQTPHRRLVITLVATGVSALVIGIGLIIYALDAYEPETAPSIPTSTVATTAPPTSVGPTTTGTGATTTTTAPPPPTTSPPVYTIDLDHDGKIDFVDSGSQLVAVPKDTSDNGPIIVALIGGIFLVASTLGAAFVTALATRSKKDGPAVVIQNYPAPPTSEGDGGPGAPAA